MGDLIDRGKDSEGVIDFVRANGIETVRGNHEEMLLECLPHLGTKSTCWLLGGTDWYLNGGHDVVTQYSSRTKLISDAEWLLTLPMYIETGIKDTDGLELLVSHAWVTQYEDIKAQSNTFHFTWARNQPTYIFDTKYYNVFGHTPVDYLKQDMYHVGEPRIPKPIFYEKAAAIDTGAAYRRRGRGYLTGIFFPSLEVRQVKTKEY